MKFTRQVQFIASENFLKGLSTVTVLSDICDVRREI